jgi:hypothetical protein
MMSALHDMGVAMGHFKDAYDGGVSGVNFANVDPATLQKALHERDYFFKQALGYKKKCEMVEVGASSLTKQVDALKTLKKVDETKLAAYKGKVADLEGRLLAKDADVADKDAALAAKDAELIAKDAELKAKDTEIAQLLKERTANFLGSRSFRCAVSQASVHLLRYSIYEQLKDLGRSFPFLPEHLGYAAVPEEEAGVMALEGYTWNPDRDILINPEGKDVVFERLDLATEENTGLPHIWTDVAKWPSDIPLPPPEEDEEEVAAGNRGEEATPEEDPTSRHDVAS